MRVPRAWLHLRDLMHALVRNEIQLRYRGTTFGLIWSIANPLVFAIVLHVAFRRIVRLDVENYAVFLLVGLFPWQWIQNSLSVGTTTFIQNRLLLRKVPFPRLALSTAVVLSDGFHFLATIPILFVLVWRAGDGIDPLVWLLGVPVLVTIQAVLLASLATLLACANAFLRDLEHAVRVGLLLAFYVTPIIFPTRMVPGDLHWLILLNPFAPLIVCWRTLLLESSLSPLLPWAVLHATLAAAAAAPVYRRIAWRVPEVV
jgi:lipopolysaccharide transport system permease protein